MKLNHTSFHFIGIGGIGMSGLAELLFNMGARISGSDLSENEQVLRLKSLGIDVFRGHDSSNLGQVDVVVYSSAVPQNNPEIQEARRRKIPIIPRAEILAEVMRLKRGIAVAGSHGKTTTTSMLASVFINAGLDPTVVVGGRLDLIKSTSKLGAGEWLIGEADESDGSFLKLQPEISVITNIDNDHLDHYHSFENIRKAFLEFAKKIPFYGACVVCGDDPEVRKLFSSFDKKITFYGFNPANDYFLKKNNNQFEVYHGGEKIAHFRLNVFGDHNALNALAAIVVGLCSGIEIEKCVQGVELYRGVDRRMQLLGEVNGVRFYDDYGHHPTEIRIVLKALRERYPDNRLVVAFQPHRYSRTKELWEDFKLALQNCDQLYLFDIYPASEKPIEGITTPNLIKEMKHNSCQYIKKEEFNAQSFSSYLKKGDVFVSLGAGDISKLGKLIFECYKK